jgi:NAD-dependent SIR2 family protein deacetylase
MAVADEQRTREDAALKLRSHRCENIVIFLGAGASATFGYPLTSEILPTILRWINDDDFLDGFPGDPENTGRQNRALLKSHISRTLPGKSLKRNNLPLVTSLLSLTDYAIITDQSLLPGQSIDELRRVRRLLERGILEVIGDHEYFTGAEEKLLERFCSVLGHISNLETCNRLTIITTNYDIAADEIAFRCASVARGRRRYWEEDSIAARVDFGFPWLHSRMERVRQYPQPETPLLAVYKLHGSTNWLRCPLCANIYINPQSSIWHQAYRQRLDWNNRCHCSATKLVAQIVSPSFVREMREPNLLSTWKGALDALRRASHWIVIGYSFPDEDLGVRALLTRAYGSRVNRPHITVIQRDDSAFPRYDAFFDSDGLTYCVGGLSAFIKACEARFK